MNRTRLHVFADDLHDLQVEQLDGRGRQVDVTQQAEDDLQQGLLHAGKSLFQELRGRGGSKEKGRGGWSQPQTSFGSSRHERKKERRVRSLTSAR